MEIIFDGDQVEEIFCDCPYAEDGNPCKHMVAVLYAIEEDEVQISRALEQKSKSVQEKEAFKSLIARIPEKELREKFLELTYHNESLCDRLWITYGAEIDHRLMLHLKRRVDRIVYEYSGRYRYRDYDYDGSYSSGVQY